MHRSINKYLETFDLISLYEGKKNMISDFGLNITFSPSLKHTHTHSLSLSEYRFELLINPFI